MGDDSNFRYRREDAPQAPAGRGQEQSAEDALAELARLIGDEDPFADFAQMSSEPATPAIPTPRPPASRPQFSAPPVERRFENWQPGRRGGDSGAAPEPTVTRTRAPADPAGFREPTSFREPTARTSYTPPPPREATSFREPTGYREAPAPRDPVETRESTVSRTELRAPAPPRESTAFGGLRGRAAEQRTPDLSDAAQAERSTVRLGYGSLARKPESVAETRAPAVESYDDDYDPQDYDPRQPDPREQQRQQAYAPQAYAAPTSAQGRQPSAAQDQYDDYDDTYDPAYGDDGYMPPHGEDVYETEAPRNRGRIALIAVAALIGVGVAATAGIVAFRQGSSGGGSTAAGDSAPVIRADTAPSKVAGPTGNGQTPENQKLIYDRVGGQGQPGQEKVVPREEQPMDVAAAAAASAAAQSASPTEPKRVKTVSVRSDGSIAPPSAAPAAPVQTSAVAPTAYAPTQNPIPAGMPQPKTVQTIATTGTGVPVAAPTTAAPAAAGAQANAAPTANAAGAYVVQVSSQKSEADAMGSFKVLQGRYPQLLGSYKATVKRADLGDKGIYFRAQVGPFASRDEANNLCNALQAQGGTCIVTRN